ncbi:MAG: hypothetical protein ACRDJU_11685 [Actinomycetota bacterium]
MTAAWYRYAADLRRRGRAWLGLGALIGLVAPVVLAAAVGARRSEQAYPQLVAATKQADVLVWDTTPNPQIRRWSCMPSKATSSAATPRSPGGLSASSLARI